MENKIYDLIIIGTGPAGITAGIYAARYKLDTLIIGKELGGMVSWTHLIDNVPGIPEISGKDLSSKMIEHLKKYDSCVLEQNSVSSIQKINNKIMVSSEDGKIYEGKALILALGTDKKRANIKGETEFIGKGVSYCTICDAMFYKGKDVAVVGSGDSAVKGALHLSDFANKVYLIIRKDKLSSKDEYDIEKLETKENIEIIYNSEVKEIKGENKIESILIETKENENIIQTEKKVGGFFIEIGVMPQSMILKNLGLDLNENGFIKIDNNCKTSVDGIFAAGDITVGFSDLKQIIVAASMGAISATSVKKYLS